MTRSTTDERKPAEWGAHAATWLAWPVHAYSGAAQLAGARGEIAALCEAIARDGGERVELLVADDAAEASARTALAQRGAGVRLQRVRYSDIWLRDTGPVFTHSSRARAVRAVRFRFNGWGGKYLYAHDPQVAVEIADIVGAARRDFDLVAEGGAIDVDGEGTCLTTRQCLLNPNRNPGASERDLDAVLRAALGVETVLWLDRGLEHDHTDGHVDNAARFVAPGVVVHMRADAGDRDDPQREALARIERELRSMRDAAGRKLELVALPSPGRVLGPDGEPRPASYVNFVLTNRLVIVPAFGVAADAPAREAIARAFPTRTTIALAGNALLEEGGAFHCASCDEPAAYDAERA
jgi:agmatine deiminase